MTGPAFPSRNPLSVRTGVVIVGGGISGAWLAYQLARKDVPVTVVTEDEYVPPLSRVWAAGVIGRQVLECGDDSGSKVFADVSTTQAPGWWAG